MQIKKQLESPTLGEAWIKLHKRYLPPILIVVGLDLILTLLLNLSVSEISFNLVLIELVVLCDLTFLPLAAVNSIFFAQRLFKRPVYSGWKMIVLKVLATLFGVMLMSMLLEQIYAHYGFVDDDYIVLNDSQLSPSISNVITNTFYALAIGIPIFIWQLRVEELGFQLKEKEMEQERLTQLKVKAELHALQSKINPHFLFNSFNSIASLISTNPTGAERMIVQLSELFRYSLTTQESNFVSIKEELKIVETYLEIEKIRFGENLDYKIECEANLSAVLIPRFFLQPLVENAIKHAISKIKQGELLLKITADGENIIIKLFDNGPAFPVSLDLGYGLQSTYDKLKLLYPEEHSIEFINSPAKHVFIVIKLQSQYGT